MTQRRVTDPAIGFIYINIQFISAKINSFQKRMICVLFTQQIHYIYLVQDNQHSAGKIVLPYIFVDC